MEQPDSFSSKDAVRKQFKEAKFRDIASEFFRGAPFLDLAVVSFYSLMGKRREKFGEMLAITKNEQGQIFLEKTTDKGNLIEVTDLHGNFVSKTQKLANGDVRTETKFHNGDGAEPGIVNVANKDGIIVYKEHNKWEQGGNGETETSERQWFNLQGNLVQEDVMKETKSEFSRNIKTTRRALENGVMIIVMVKNSDTLFTEGMRNETVATDYYDAGRKFDRVSEMKEYSAKGVGYSEEDQLISSRIERRHRNFSIYPDRQVVDREEIQYEDGQQKSIDKYEGQIINGRPLWTKHNGEIISKQA